MKYEFHVGDYVECRNGSIGYLTEGETWYNGTIGDDIVRLQGNVTVDVSWGFTPFTLTIPLSDISKYFNRIGQYDFTKKDEGKIEPLIYNNTPDWDDSLILDKINKLVETVNRLEEKVNEMV